MNARPRPPRDLYPSSLILAATLAVACGQDAALSRGNLTTTFDTVNGVIHVTNTAGRPSQPGRQRRGSRRTGSTKEGRNRADAATRTLRCRHNPRSRL